MKFNLKWVETLLKKHGITESDLAVVMGVSRQRVHQWKGGGMPSAMTMLTILNLFDESPDLFFVRETEEKNGK